MSSNRGRKANRIYLSPAGTVDLYGSPPGRPLRPANQFIRFRRERSQVMGKCTGYLRVLVALGVALGSGCGGKGGVIRVKGGVTLDGQPVEHARVEFQPMGKE